MKGHIGHRVAWACSALLTILATSLFSTSAAHAQSTFCLPTCSETDGRFISLAGSRYKSVAGDQVEFTLASTSADSLSFEIYDGETSGVWDAGTSPLIFTLYADPHNDTTASIVVGQWSGASMRDTGWYRIAVAHNTNARAESGAHFYKLKVRMQWGDTLDSNNVEDDAEDYYAINTWSNFKLRSTAHLMTTQFAFCAPLFSTREGYIVYPNYPVLTPTTYDGTWSLFVQVDKPMHTFEVWDGDMDFGSFDGLDMDTDDDNTNSNNVPRWSGTTAVEEGVGRGTDYIRTLLGSLLGILGTGAPMDDNYSAVYRRMNSVTYQVIDPNGASYQNTNPSGNLEWERFVIGTSGSPNQLDLTSNFLPRGVYEMRISGMDMHNLNAWRYSEGVLGSTAEGNVERMPDADCPKNAGRSVGRGSNSHSSAEISESGELYVWGDNCIGQLGDGSTTDRTNPIRVVKGEYPGTTYLGDGCNGVAQIALSHKRMIALMQDGMPYTWGDNLGGLLGIGGTTNALSPKRILKGAYPGTSYLGDDWKNPIEKVSAGEFFTAVVANSGLVYTWGKNNRGQLGDGSTTDRTAPVRVLKGAYSGTTYLGDNPRNPIIDVAAGDEFCYALAADGTVYAWGYNAAGQLGDASLTSRTAPVKVRDGAYPGTYYLGDVSSNPIVGINAMPEGGIAVSKRGLVYTWGNNNNGQLGDGTTTDRTTPVRVVKGAYAGTTYLGDNTTDPVTAVAAGGMHSLALTSTGRVYSWGRNAEGALGDGTTSGRLSPVRVLKGLYPGTTYLGDDTLITSIGGGFHHSLALCGSNNSTYSWGDGAEGRLGDGFLINRSTPVIVAVGARGGAKLTNESSAEVAPGLTSGIDIEALTVLNDATQLQLTLNAKVDSDISIELFNSIGDVIERPVDRHSMHSGSHNLEIEIPSELPSGVYFVTVRTATGSETKQFVVTR